jgi:hypothetical protein
LKLLPPIQTVIEAPKWSKNFVSGGLSGSVVETFDRKETLDVSDVSSMLITTFIKESVFAILNLPDYIYIFIANCIRSILKLLPALNPVSYAPLYCEIFSATDVLSFPYTCYIEGPSHYLGNVCLPNADRGVPSVRPQYAMLSSVM